MLPSTKFSSVALQTLGSSMDARAFNRVSVSVVFFLSCSVSARNWLLLSRRV
jgi:hypothetical protein